MLLIVNRSAVKFFLSFYQERLLFLGFFEKMGLSMYLIKGTKLTKVSIAYDIFTRTV